MIAQNDHASKKSTVWRIIVYSPDNNTNGNMNTIAIVVL